MNTSVRPLKVFLCHAHADQHSVIALHQRLVQDGVNAWLDKEALLPGHDWEFEIRKAVRESDIVLVCLSQQFNQAGYRQKEVRLALDTALEKPEGDTFIIPARLEQCEILESLAKWQWVDLFDQNGYEKLMRALQLRAGKIGAILKIPTESSLNPIRTQHNNEAWFKSDRSRLKILVTGGRNTSLINRGVAFLIGYQLILRGHILLNHGSKGIDKEAAEGALLGCQEKQCSEYELIHVFRPFEGAIPEFYIGSLHTIGQTYQDRRDYVIAHSSAVIILGGGRGTRDVAQQAEAVGIPLIPVGIGNAPEAAFEIWQRMLSKPESIKSAIGRNDLKKIGDPKDYDLLALNSVILAESLARKRR